MHAQLTACTPLGAYPILGRSHVRILSDRVVREAVMTIYKLLKNCSILCVADQNVKVSRAYSGNMTIFHFMSIAVNLEIFN